METLPRFGDWRLLNAPALVYGRVAAADDGRLKVEFRLWDVFAEQQLAGLAYFTAPANWRRIAHIIADAIYKRMTGEDGYFDTRIVYIAETGPQTKRIKRLAIMDQDGANHRFLTDGTDLVLTPRFSPSLQEITYLVLRRQRPRVFIRDIDTNRQEVVGDFPGMTFSPRFSPDGEKLVLSLAKDGNSEIYTIDLRTRASRRLTNNAGIDTSPSYAPDGRQIVFNSDRGGSQQLYLMDADGGNVRRISHGQGRYFTPVWSPRGDLIAFTKILGGKFYIGVMSPGRQRRADAGRRLSRRRADLGAQRPGADVLPQGSQRRRRWRRPLQALYHRPHRPERAEDRDAGRCVRSRVVAAASLRQPWRHAARPSMRLVTGPQDCAGYRRRWRREI